MDPEAAATASPAAAATNKAELPAMQPPITSLPQPNLRPFTLHAESRTESAPEGLDPARTQTSAKAASAEAGTAPALADEASLSPLKDSHGLLPGKQPGDSLPGSETSSHALAANDNARETNPGEAGEAVAASMTNNQQCENSQAVPTQLPAAAAQHYSPQLPEPGSTAIQHPLPTAEPQLGDVQPMSGAHCDVKGSGSADSRPIAEQDGQSQPAAPSSSDGKDIDVGKESQVTSGQAQRSEVEAAGTQADRQPNSQPMPGASMREAEQGHNIEEQVNVGTSTEMKGLPTTPLMPGLDEREGGEPFREGSRDEDLAKLDDPSASAIAGLAESEQGAEASDKPVLKRPSEAMKERTRQAQVRAIQSCLPEFRA